MAKEYALLLVEYDTGNFPNTPEDLNSKTRVAIVSKRPIDRIREDNRHAIFESLKRAAKELSSS